MTYFLTFLAGVFVGVVILGVFHVGARGDED